MPVVETSPPPILKGASFTRRVREICRVLPEPDASADLKYRRILIPGLLGGEIQFSLLGFLGHAMRLRGAHVTALLCDAFTYGDKRIHLSTVGIRARRGNIQLLPDVPDEL